MDGTTIAEKEQISDEDVNRWTTGAGYISGGDWKITRGTHRGAQHGVVPSDYPKQVVSFAKAKSVPTHMSEFLASVQRQYRINLSTRTVEKDFSRNRMTVD